MEKKYQEQSTKLTANNYIDYEDEIVDMDDYDDDWNLENNWYQKNEGELSQAQNLQFNLNQYELSKMEQDLTYKNTRTNFKTLKDKEKFVEQNKWELQKMIDSGVLKMNLNINNDDYDDHRNILKFHEIKPPFLSDQEFNKKIQQNFEFQNSKTDMDRLAKKGSLLLKSLRESNDKIKFFMKNIQQNFRENLNQSHNYDNKYKDSIQKKNIAQSNFSYSKTLKEQREFLPIFQTKKKLMKLIRDNKIIIIVGETGSGKTTQLTQYMYEEGYGHLGKIACTQPRRVAAVSVAKRVSEEMQCKLGDKVGYSIRFESVCSNNTIIKYMTDGVLLRESLNDENLEQYSVIIMDEAHERSLHTDVLFGILKKIVSQRRDLKLIITSATMNADKFSKFFFNAPVYKIKGRTFPVEIIYSQQTIEDYVDGAIKKAIEIHISNGPGDILIFMTGQEDVEATCFLMKQRLLRIPQVQQLLVLPIYSQLPSELQAKIFQPCQYRKCIVATNIAETSLTLDGVKFVIDTGFCKMKVYNPKIGMDGLQVWPISQANADQRSGRAGRTGPGKCYRLYRAYSYRNEMRECNMPEIQRTNLSNVILLLKSLNIKNLMDFDFLDPPPQETIFQSLYQLWTLEALDDRGNLTQLGKQMSEFPLDPPLSKILLVSQKYQVLEQVLVIVSMLSVPAIFYRPKGQESRADQQRSKLLVAESDHLSLYNIFRLWKSNNYTERWCKEKYIHYKAMKKVKEVLRQLKEILKSLKINISSSQNTDVVRKVICSGYFFNVARIKKIGEYYNLKNGLACTVHPSSALFLLGYVPDYLVYHEIILTSKEYMHCVTAVDPKWMVELAPKYFTIGNQELPEQNYNKDISKQYKPKISKNEQLLQTLKEINEKKKKIKKQQKNNFGFKKKFKRFNQLSIIMSNNYIFDLGSWEVKCGTNDLNLPIRISSYIGYHLFPGPNQEIQPNIYGEFDHQKSQYFYQQSICNGQIQDIDSIYKIYETCIKKTDNENFNGNLIMPIQIDFQPREICKLVKLFFDESDIQTISFPLQPFCSFQYFGQDTGCIIEIGNDTTQCICLLQNQDLQTKSKYNFGAKHVQVYLKTLMQNDGLYIKPQMSYQIEKDILENFCQNLTKRKGHLLKLGEHSGPLIDEVSYIFPDGQEIMLGDERYMAPEVTYQPDLYGLNFKGLQHLIANTINKIDNDLRQPMYNNLLISGGYTNLQGFPERLTEELQEISPQKCNVSLKYSNENRQNLVWKGASILSDSEYLKSIKWFIIY